MLRCHRSQKPLRMTANLSPILEKWAELYTPIAHNPEKGSKDKAYYEIRTINDNSEFVRNQNTAKSPALAYSILIDAEGTNSRVVNYAHTIYFLARAASRSLAKSARQDDALGGNMEMMLDEMVQDLIAYLRELKHNQRCPLTGQTYDRATMMALSALDLDKAEWASIPVKYAEWHVMGLQLEQNTPRQLCINREKYKV